MVSVMGESSKGLKQEHNTIKPGVEERKGFENEREVNWNATVIWDHLSVPLPNPTIDNKVGFMSGYRGRLLLRYWGVGVQLPRYWHWSVICYSVCFELLFRCLIHAVRMNYFNLLFNLNLFFFSFSVSASSLEKEKIDWFLWFCVNHILTGMRICCLVCWVTSMNCLLRFVQKITSSLSKKNQNS